MVEEGWYGNSRVGEGEGGKLEEGLASISFSPFNRERQWSKVVYLLSSFTPRPFAGLLCSWIKWQSHTTSNASTSGVGRGWSLLLDRTWAGSVLSHFAGMVLEAYLAV